MKVKKLLVVLVVAAFLVIGWGIALRKPETVDLVAHQKSLLEEAEVFIKRELYLRAIPLLEEARNLQGNKEISLTIEASLMDAYRKNNDIDKYILLAQSRAKNGTATEKEYIEAANAYLAVGDTATAIEVLRNGMAQYDSVEIKNLYMKSRYAYRLIKTLFTEILPSIHNSMMPSYDGENWNYVTPAGKKTLPNVYSYASPFVTDGFAVVKENGTFYCINSEGKHYGVDDSAEYSRVESVKYVVGSDIIGKRDGKYQIMDYDFIPKNDFVFDDITSTSEGIRAIKEKEGWMILSEDFFILLDQYFEEVGINSVGCVFESGRGMLRIGEKWYLYFRDTEGKLSRVQNGFDGAKAPESDGYIAVADESGRWGFVDDYGKTVIGYKFEDAKSFSDGLAAVKNDGEWFYINTEGEEVFEGLRFDEAEPFHSGVTQVKKNGFVSILSLNYLYE